MATTPLTKKQLQQRENEDGADLLNSSGDAPAADSGYRPVSVSPSIDNSGVNAISIENLNSPSKNSLMDDVKCDDCSRPEPIRLWRWCHGCERVLCETCAVEGHVTHNIESYACAVRHYDEMHRQLIDKARVEVDKLTDGAKHADELKSEIVTNINGVLREIQAKIEENKDVEATLTELLASMMTLKDEPLNAKTWAERNESTAGVEGMMKMAFEKQKDTEDCMKKIDALVDEGGRKLGEIFREEH